MREEGFPPVEVLMLRSAERGLPEDDKDGESGTALIGELGVLPVEDETARCGRRFVEDVGGWGRSRIGLTDDLPTNAVRCFVDECCGEAGWCCDAAADDPGNDEEKKVRDVALPAIDSDTGTVESSSNAFCSSGLSEL